MWAWAKIARRLEGHAQSPCQPARCRKGVAHQPTGEERRRRRVRGKRERSGPHCKGCGRVGAVLQRLPDRADVALHRDVLGFSVDVGDLCRIDPIDHERNAMKLSTSMLAISAVLLLGACGDRQSTKSSSLPPPITSSTTPSSSAMTTPSPAPSSDSTASTSSSSATSSAAAKDSSASNTAAQDSSSNPSGTLSSSQEGQAMPKAGQANNSNPAYQKGKS